MRRKYPRLRLALLAALPLEAINFWVIGYPASTPPVSRLSQDPAVALQWYLLHLGGIIAADRSHYLRQHATLVSIVLFIAGYIGSAIVLLAVLWFAGLARRTFRRLSSPLKQAA